MVFVKLIFPIDFSHKRTISSEFYSVSDKAEICEYLFKYAMERLRGSVLFIFILNGFGVDILFPLKYPPANDVQIYK